MRSIALVFALFSTIAYSAPSPLSSVSSGDSIAANKFNEVVDKINKLQSQGVLGEIKPSILNETAFQSITGNCWVLMDGRNIAGKDLAVAAGITNIPDARGVALRGKNNNRSDGLQNPDGDLAIGQFQGDSFGLHTHIQNAHTHGQDAHNHGLGNDNGQQVFVSSGVAGAGAALGPNVQGTPTNYQYQYTAGRVAVNHNTTAINQNSGGNETRMKSITVNYFIKIHNTCN